MKNAPDVKAIGHILAANADTHSGVGIRVRALNASSFCSTWRADGVGDIGRAGGALFVKSVPAHQAHILTAEADGLRAIAATKTVTVPAVLGCWTDDDQHVTVLALEWLDLRAAHHADFGKRLGQALAALHGAPLPDGYGYGCGDGSGSGRFGWHRNNMLGATVQRNRWSQQGGLTGWLEFFGRERLGALREQLAAAHAAHELLDTIDRVINALPAFFADGYIPQPGLVHGDLWSGNWGCLAQGHGTPVIFDPAVSISDKEAELAMMELFGQPPPGFWPAYREVAGLAPGYAWRRGLYQLYHVLNHELLFGGYARSAMAIMQQLLTTFTASGKMTGG